MKGIFSSAKTSIGMMRVTTAVLAVCALLAAVWSLFTGKFTELIIAIFLFVSILITNELLRRLQSKEAESKGFARETDQLVMLNDIGKAIATLGDLNSVLNIIRQQIQRIVPMNAFMVMLYHPESNTVSYPLVYDNGLNWSEPAKELTPDMKSYEIIKITHKSILMNLSEEEFEQRARQENRSLIGDRAKPYRSFLYAPLSIQNKIIGVAGVISYDYGVYNDEHLNLLEKVATQAAIAIENARLYQAQQKELAERKQAEEEVRSLNSELESRVEKRTLQLQEANEHLNLEKARLERYNKQREIMSRMIDLLQASLTTEEASSIIHNHLELIFTKQDGALYLINASGVLEPVVLWGESDHLNHTFSGNECWGIRRGKPYLFGKSNPNPACLHTEKNPRHHCLCVPLSPQGENIGSFHISAQNDAELEEDDQNLAVILADSIALALANLRLREKLQFQSVRDGLTSLFNRRYLDDVLPRELNRARQSGSPISVLMFDVDHFKKFNDMYGHEAGDLVLRQISQLITNNIRENDIACRYGGEEFIIILPNTDSETAAQRADLLCQSTARLELSMNGNDLGKITISIGVATHPHHGQTRDSLIRSADEALYTAKQNGRNQVVLRGT